MKNKFTKLFTLATLITVVLSANAFAFRPIFHPPTVSILDALRNDQENFSILVGLIKDSGLDELTKEGKSFTLLAPTNAAFAQLPAGTLESFKKDKNRLRQLLFNHLLPGKALIQKVSPAEGVSDPCVINPQSFTSLNGTPVNIGCDQNISQAETVHFPLVNGMAHILESNFEGSSAAIQVVDTVLLSAEDLASVSGLKFNRSPTIGVDSGQPAIGSFFDIPARTDVASGLSTTTFDTLEGTVTVNLPDDLAAGDTISGTVIAEPKGKTGDEQAKNQDELSGYVVEVADQSTPKENVTGNLIDFCKDPAAKTNDYAITVCSKWSVPDAVKTVVVVLKNREGKIVSHADVPVAPKANPAKVTEGLLIPAVGQAGKPLSVKGPFDGDFASTAIKLGNQTAKFLASSPRKVVVQNPSNAKGVAQVEIHYAGKIVANCTYRSISVNLAAGKLNLTKGEQTTLTVTLAGLIGLLTPVSVQLSNKSSGTVSMGGGEIQTIEVDPAQVNGDTFSTKRTL
ncbi:MAG: fasciclin domain-containing protein, partial [Pyrinomonadaceae bacterium]